MQDQPAGSKRYLEPIDRELVDAFVDREPGPGPAQILLVGPLTDPWHAIASQLEQRGHRCRHERLLDVARERVRGGDYDLILLDPALPDGDGFDLLEEAQRHSPSTKTIVVTDSMSVQIAVRAIRHGVVDCLTPTTDGADLIGCVDGALLKSRSERHREKRLKRLKQICKELNIARHEISKQVDILCDDLASAYKEIGEQMSEVALTSEFRTLLKQELDVEDVLRTMLEYLLTRTGPTNAAVFLPDGGNQHGLGAYVNYDCPDDSIAPLLDHLCLAICPQMERESEIVRFDDADEFASWIGVDAAFLTNSQVLAMPCAHEGECLAVIVLFRNAEQPFQPELASTLDIMRGIIGEQLARIINIHHRAQPQWPRDAVDDEQDYDEFGFGVGGMAA